MFNFLKTLAVFLGTIIGVGIFALPYAASKAGFPIIILYFLIITTVVLIIHLLFARVCFHTKNIHRLAGYAGEYLGKRWKRITVLTTGFGVTGASLAYLIVGGEFLKALLSPLFGGEVFIYTLVFFGLGAYLIFRGIEAISHFELALLFALFGILLVFFAKSVALINTEYLLVIDWKFLALPYGIILFSIWGLPVVPALKEMLCKDFLEKKLGLPKEIKNKRAEADLIKKKIDKVIIYGILISAVTYLFFIFIIFGTCGANTSQDAISGFTKALGNGTVALGFIFGLIACFTSYIALGLVFKKTLWYDFGLPKNLSWFIVCFVPLTLYFLGFKEFINVIGFTGALAMGIEGIIIVLLYKAFLKKKFSRKMNPLLYILPAFFVLGIAFEIFHFVFRG
jgi:tyrosine-specific transport protein